MAFLGFRTITRPYFTVFTMVGENLVVVTAEYKHGNDRVTLVPVSGCPTKAEEASVSTAVPSMHECMEIAARRIFKHETGLTLGEISHLGPADGIFAEARKMRARYFPLLAYVDELVPKKEPEQSSSDILQIILFPLQEWLKLLHSPSLWDKEPDFGMEACARDVTYAAMLKMGTLRSSL